MGYPASVKNIGDQFREVDALQVQFKATLQARITEMAAGAVGIDVMFGLFRILHKNRAALVGIKDRAGVIAEGKAQKDDNALNVKTQWESQISDIDTAATWITTNVTASGVSWGSTSETYATMSSASTADLRTALQAVVDEIT